MCPATGPEMVSLSSMFSLLCGRLALCSGPVWWNAVGGLWYNLRFFTLLPAESPSQRSNAAAPQAREGWTANPVTDGRDDQDPKQSIFRKKVLCFKEQQSWTLSSWLADFGAVLRQVLTAKPRLALNSRCSCLSTGAPDVHRHS